MTPQYTATYDRMPIYRGDTVPPMNMRITDSENNPIIPVGICCEARNSFGGLVYIFSYEIDAETGSVTIGAIDADESKRLPVGALVYDVQYTLADGRVRTYLSGSITIIGDVSRC